MWIRVWLWWEGFSFFNINKKILKRVGETPHLSALFVPLAVLNTLQRCRRQESVFDDRCWSAEAQGMMIKRSSYIEQMEEAIAEGGPGSAIKMQGLCELLNENTWTAGRLVSRMSDRVSVASTVKHVVVGWRNQDGSVEPISHKPAALTTNAEKFGKWRFRGGSHFHHQ